MNRQQINDIFNQLFGYYESIDEDDLIYQLTTGFWMRDGRTSRKFDLGPGNSLTVNITGLNDEGKGLAREALAAWSAVTGITFRETAGNNADILFDDTGSATRAYAETRTVNGIVVEAKVVVPAAFLERHNANEDTKNANLSAYIHEIGHVLGLGHSGDYDSGEDYYHKLGKVKGDFDLFTVMSYAYAGNTGLPLLGTEPATPMLYDILAAWEIYGKPIEGVNAGDTIYSAQRDIPKVLFYEIPPPALPGQFRSEGSPQVVTLVDTGGQDTLHLDAAGSSIIEFRNIGGKTIGFGSIDTDRVVEDINDKLTINLVVYGEIEVIYGGDGDDIITGGPSDNRLAGGPGNDQLSGGKGADVFVVTPDDGKTTDMILDFNPAEGDRIDVSAYPNRNNTPDSVIQSHEVPGKGTITSRFIDVDGDGSYDLGLEGYTAQLKESNFIFTSDMPDIPTVAPAPITGKEIRGTAGRDELIGTNAAETLNGLDGSDILNGRGGGDTLIGGSGEDFASYEDSPAGVTVRLHTGAAKGGHAEGDIWNLITIDYIDGKGNLQQEIVPDIERLIGSAHDDILAGDSRDNWLDGGEGNDMLYGGPGGGNDHIQAGSGNDSLYGGLGNDELQGGAGNDRLFGGLGDDYLSAALGDDTLQGGPGNDELIGSEGADTLTGGSGADEFRFFPGDTPTDSSTHMDIITDFDPAEGDRIVLEDHNNTYFQGTRWKGNYWHQDGHTLVDLDGNGLSDIILENYTGIMTDEYLIIG